MKSWEQILHEFGLVPPAQSMRDQEDLISEIGEAEFCKVFLKTVQKINPSAFAGQSWRDIMDLRIVMRAEQEEQLGLTNHVPPEEEYLFLLVQYRNGQRAWCIADYDAEVQTGDHVRVQHGNQLIIGDVTACQYCTDSDAPCPPDDADRFDRVVTLPEESELFTALCRNIDHALAINAARYSSKKITAFREKVLQALESFGQGNDIDEFSFSGESRYNDNLSYISIDANSSEIEVSCGGSVYTPNVGSDSYTDWSYFINNVGNEDACGVDENTMDCIGEYLSGCSVFQIDAPEEFMFNSDEGPDEVHLKDCICLYDCTPQMCEWRPLQPETLASISGMLTQFLLKDGTVKVGYVDPPGLHDTPADGRSRGDAVYIWTWRHLNEDTHELVGSKDTMYDVDFDKIPICEILRANAILYSHPRWGGSLTNRFYVELINNDLEEKGTEDAITRYLLTLENPSEAAALLTLLEEQDMPDSILENMEAAYWDRYNVDLSEIQ